MWHTYHVTCTIPNTSMKALYEPPHLRKTEINQDSSYTKEDLENDKNNNDSFKSFSMGRIDTLLEEFEHIL
jgi:hypothetical protein